MPFWMTGSPNRTKFEYCCYLLCLHHQELISQATQLISITPLRNLMSFTVVLYCLKVAQAGALHEMKATKFHNLFRSVVVYKNWQRDIQRRTSHT